MAATAEFRFGRSEGDVKSAFGRAPPRRCRPSPSCISGSDAFWSAKTGQMNLRKDRTWVTLSVGRRRSPPTAIPSRRRRLAELIVKKL